MGFTVFDSEEKYSRTMEEAERTRFNIEEVPIACIRAPGHYLAYPRRKSCLHMSVTDIYELLFCHNSYGYGDTLLEEGAQQ